MEKRTTLVIEQIFGDIKKLRNEEKYLIKNHETLLTIILKKKRYVFYSLNSQTDRQNIYRIVAYI